MRCADKLLLALTTDADPAIRGHKFIKHLKANKKALLARRHPDFGPLGHDIELFLYNKGPAATFPFPTGVASAKVDDEIKSFIKESEDRAQHAFKQLVADATATMLTSPEASRFRVGLLRRALGEAAAAHPAVRLCLSAVTEKGHMKHSLDHMLVWNLQCRNAGRRTVELVRHYCKTGEQMEETLAALRQIAARSAQLELHLLQSGLSEEHKAMVTYTPAAVVWLLHNKGAAEAAAAAARQEQEQENLNFADLVGRQRRELGQRLELQANLQRLVAAIETQVKMARTIVQGWHWVHREHYLGAPPDYFSQRGTPSHCVELLNDHFNEALRNSSLGKRLGKEKPRFDIVVVLEDIRRAMGKSRIGPRFGWCPVSRKNKWMDNMMAW